MRTKRLVVIIVLLALTLPAPPAHAGGTVGVCDEFHLWAALAGGGTVTFSCSGEIILTFTITITENTTIDGSGQTVTISGNHAVRVFTVNSGATLNLNQLTIANGKATGDCGGGIRNGGRLTVNNSTVSGNSADCGGGIGNMWGTVIVNNSTFSGNSAVDPYGESGGGIFNTYGGTVTVSNSTFAGNSAAFAGGGVYNYGTATVSNSTFAGNSASQEGGGINNQGTVTVSNSTFSGNSAAFSGGGVYNVFGTLTLKNTIIANSPTGWNCGGNSIEDGGGNLSYPDTTCPGINGDPMLGPLQNNGGPTGTVELGPGSAAFEAGNDATCAAAPVNNLDQRGVTRPQGAHCDIGAVEHLLPFRKWFPAAHAR